MKILSGFFIALSLIGSPINAIASSDSVFPISNPTEACRGAIHIGGTAAFNYCINHEQLYYNLAKDDWLDVSEQNKSYCLNLMGKNVNSADFYFGFETCLNQRLRVQAAETPAEFNY